MKRGTMSLLFGVHQLFWHPFTVMLGWWELYGRPSWRELVCIFIHDWGYWGCETIDGIDGAKHPEVGGDIAWRLFRRPDLQLLVYYHSRHYARRHDTEPSKLCYADKLSIKYDPWWFYLLRAKLSGELAEFKPNGERFVGHPMTDREWFIWVQAHLVKVATEQRGDAVPYTNEVVK